MCYNTHYKTMNIKILLASLFSVLAIGVLTVVIFQAFDQGNKEVQATTSRIGDDPINNTNLMRVVNNWKVSQGKEPYIESEFLCRAAELRVVEVQSNWSHNGFHASRFCENCHVGENLSRGAQTATETLNNWLNSPAHRALLDMSYTHACIVTDGTYAVQLFGYY